MTVIWKVAEALLEFQRSYDLKPHFAVLYNVGQAQSVLGRSVEAVDTFERYLRQGGKAIKPARRKEVEQDVARQKARIATLEIRVTPDGAPICVDGKDVGLAPMSQGVRVWTWRISLRKPGAFSSMVSSTSFSKAALVSGVQGFSARV